jgi:hypothetical protein
MKTCFKCNTEKPLSEYYRLARMADGHLNKCKECTKMDVKKHRTDNLDKVREYDRSRSMLPHRVQARKEYSLTDAGKASHSRASRKYLKNNPERINQGRKRHPEKYAAHNAVWSALVTGKMVRPSNCQQCATECTPHGHHEDYSKPLDVMWLCVPCHAARHRELKQQRAA